MPSVVDQRLASLLHQEQIERLIRVEGIADELSTVIQRIGRQILEHAQAGELSAGSRLLRSIPSRLLPILDDRFRRLAQYVHSTGIDVLVKAIPRKWFRLAKQPAGVLVGESLGLDSIGLAPGVIGEIPEEPVAGQRMSDAEWAAYVKRNVLPPPSEAKVSEILQRPTAGQTYPERISGLSKLVKEPERLIAELATGYGQGQTRAELANRIKPLVGRIDASAKRIARTEGLRIANKVQREIYDDMGDMIQGYQIVATLDQNTRPEHALRNGTIYYVSGRLPLATSRPDLPDAPNCRCFEVPVLQPPIEFETDPAVMAEFKTAAGVLIPDPAAYDQWFDQADEGRRRLAVGSRRYDIVKQRLGNTRKPEWTDFLDGNGELLSLFKLQGADPGELFREKSQLMTTIKARNELLQQVRTTGFSDSRLSPAGVVAQRDPAPIRQPGQTRRMPAKKVLDELAAITDRLPPDQLKAVVDYTTFEYGQIVNWEKLNKKLRDGVALNKKEQAAYNKLQRAANSGSLPPGLVVYRGIDFSDEPLSRTGMIDRAKQALRDGVPLSMPGINSTSVDVNVAARWSNPRKSAVVLEIRPKTGIYIGRVSEESREFEVLMPDGKGYQVLGIRESARFPDGDSRLVIELQEL